MHFDIDNINLSSLVHKQDLQLIPSSGFLAQYTQAFVRQALFFNLVLLLIDFNEVNKLAYFRLLIAYLVVEDTVVRL
jgi:hypothetical protein